METKSPTKTNPSGNDIMKRSSSSDSSLTDIDSPLNLHSPTRSDQGEPHPPDADYTSPLHASPGKSPFVDSKVLVVADDKSNNANSSPLRLPLPPPPTTPPQQSLHLTVNLAVREEGPGVTTRRKVSGGGEGEGGGRGTRALKEVLRRSKVKEMVKMAALGFRLSEFILCLISFSVMAADKTQGWSGDAFDRYKEYRYCLSVNVIGFAYAGFQAYDLSYYLITQKHVIHHYLRQPFEFFMDQLLAYILISASSAAATRVDNWQSNWGKDEFTEMISASVSMAFLAFIAFAFSSLISGYELTRESP